LTCRDEGTLANPRPPGRGAPTIQPLKAIIGKTTAARPIAHNHFFFISYLLLKFPLNYNGKFAI
jgi:hypothetical protein